MTSFPGVTGSFPERLPLPLLLQLTMRAVSDRVSSEMATRGYEHIRFTHTLLLTHLVAGEGLAQTTLAERAGISKQAMGELLRELEQMGIVERRTNPGDRRSKQIWLTERGSRGSEEAMAVVNTLESELRAQIGDEFLNLVHHGLVQVLQRLTAGAD